MAGKIFINYRREESGHVAGRLHDRLAQAFGRDNLFMDVDNIPVGVDFVTHLNDQVAACDAVLVVIGPNWLKAKGKAGQRRLHQPDDFVAIEIAAALTRDIRVIPVLVDGARMPRASELPDALKPLARRQAAEVRHVNFAQDAETLVARMRKSLGDKTLVKGGPEAVGDKAAVVRELERLTAQEGKAKVEAEAEAEAKRRADEAEQQRLAATKAEQERQVREAAGAQRQANIRAEQERQKQAEAEARQQAELEARRLEAKRRAEEEQQRKQLEAKAREAEAKRLADEEKRRKRAEREPLIATMGKALADKARGQDRWRVGPVAGVAAILVLLLVGAGGYTFFRYFAERGVHQAWEEERAKAAADAQERTAAVDRFLLQGNAAAVAGDYDSAIANYNEALRLNPQNARALSAAAEAEAKRKADESERQRLAATVQHVALYDEDANDPKGRRYTGLIKWRTEKTVSIGQPRTAPANVAVHADVEIPELKLRMTWSLRRNTDKTLPASHTVEIVFTVPSDFLQGGISNVPGLLMKRNETKRRGVPLAGLLVKVTDGRFLVGLSAVEADVQRNIKLLMENDWVDVPMVYTSGKRAILAMVKGPPGTHAFEAAFRAWAQ